MAMNWTVISLAGKEVEISESGAARNHFASIMASAIQSFLNNNWQDRACDIPGCRDHLLTFWTCGEIPFRSLPWE